MKSKEAMMDKIVFIGNATARMQVPVHPHGWWRGGNVGYDPANERLITNTPIQRSVRKTTTTDTSVTLYTVTTGFTLWVKTIWLSNWAAGAQQIAVKDAATATQPADGTVNSIAWLSISLPSNVNLVLTFDVPLKFSTAFSTVGAATSEYVAGFSGFEEET